MVVPGWYERSWAVFPVSFGYYRRPRCFVHRDQWEQDFHCAIDYIFNCWRNFALYLTGIGFYLTRFVLTFLREFDATENYEQIHQAFAYCCLNVWMSNPARTSSSSWQNFRSVSVFKNSWLRLNVWDKFLSRYSTSRAFTNRNAPWSQWLEEAQEWCWKKLCHRAE